MNKWKILACSLAGVTLAGALTYYNFIDKADESKLVVGETCPNFIAQVYDVEGETFSVGYDLFTVGANKGKVCVLNFWETWCSACIQELYEFNQIQIDYGDQVAVAAIVGADVERTAQNGVDWLNEKGWLELDPDRNWAEFTLTFAYLDADKCVDLGYTGVLPRTVIVDKEGKVAYEASKPMTHSQLQEEINKLL